MLGDLIKSWLRRARPPNVPRPLPVHPPGRTRHGIDPLLANVARYPPFLEGLPVVKPESLMDAQAELIDRIQQTVAVPREDFGRLVVPAIQRFAGLVQLLPASDAHHHRGAGGMFRHGLEVAYFASRAADGAVFVPLDRWASERRVLEPRYRVGSCIAGLLHDIGKAVSNVTVVSADGQHQWMPHTETLYDWARRRRIDRYFLRWRAGEHNRHQLTGLSLIDHVIDRPLKGWFNQGGPQLFEDVTGAIAGVDSAANRVAKVVSDADAASTRRDIQTWRQLGGAGESLGVPVSRHLVDAMRRLHRSGGWKINGANARLWYVGQGRDASLFVVWPGGAQDVLAVLGADRMPGIPRDPQILADILVEDGVALPFVAEDGVRYATWRIAPEHFRGEGKRGAVLHAVRLRNAATLTDVPPAPDGGDVLPPVDGLAQAPDEEARPAAARVPAVAKPEDQVTLSPPPRPAPPDAGARPRKTGAPGEDDATREGTGRKGDSRPIAPSADRAGPREPPPPAPRTAWFDRRTDVGPHLLELARRLADGRLVHGRDFGFFETQGSPLLSVTSKVVLEIHSRMLPLLEQRRLIAKDRATPGLKTRHVAGLGQAIVLSADASRAVLEFAGTRPADWPVLPDRPAPARQPGAPKPGKLRHPEARPEESSASPAEEARVVGSFKPQPEVPTDGEVVERFSAYIDRKGMAERQQFEAALVMDFASEIGVAYRLATRALTRGGGFRNIALGGLARVTDEAHR